MPATAVMNRDLRQCDGFRVESPEGLIGWVEEVWLGVRNEPLALAVKRTDGRRGLLSADDVAAVVSEDQWVIVSSQPALLELDAPRLEALDSGSDSRVVASWATTGAALPPPTEPGTFRRAAFAFRLRRPLRTVDAQVGAEPPILPAVAFLLGGIFLTVAAVITLAFVVSYLVTGHAY